MTVETEVNGDSKSTNSGSLDLQCWNFRAIYGVKAPNRNMGYHIGPPPGYISWWAGTTTRFLLGS